MKVDLNRTEDNNEHFYSDIILPTLNVNEIKHNTENKFNKLKESVKDDILDYNNMDKLIDNSNGAFSWGFTLSALFIVINFFTWVLFSEVEQAKVIFIINCIISIISVIFSVTASILHDRAVNERDKIYNNLLNAYKDFCIANNVEILDSYVTKHIIEYEITKVFDNNHILDYVYEDLFDAVDFLNNYAKDDKFKIKVADSGDNEIDLEAYINNRKYATCEVYYNTLEDFKSIFEYYDTLNFSYLDRIYNNKEEY